MKANAIKFNGPGTQIAEEAIQIFEFVKSKIEESRGELASLEEAVQEQMDSKPKKKAKKTKTTVRANNASSGSAAASANDNWADIDFDNLSDDSD